MLQSAQGSCGEQKSPNVIRTVARALIRCVADADDSLLINSQKRQIVDLKTKVIIVEWFFKNIMKFGAHFIVLSR